MTLQKALDMVRIEYERAQGLALVRNPLAYALHKVWKIADGQPPGTGAQIQNDCDSCAVAGSCQYVPRVGSICRINCPLWRPKG